MKTRPARLERLEAEVDEVVVAMVKALLDRVRSVHGMEGLRQLHGALSEAQAEDLIGVVVALPDDLRAIVEEVYSDFETRLESH